MSEVALQPEEFKALTRARRIAMATGILSIVAGVIVLAKPGSSVKTLAVVAGVFILVDGIVELAAALGRHPSERALPVVTGVLDIVVGVLLIRHPMNGVFAIALLLGAWLVVAGLVRAMGAFGDDDARLRRLVSAAVLTIAGVVIVAAPHIGYATLALVTGIAFVGYGAGTLLLSWALRVLTDDHAAPGRAAGVAG